MVPILKVVEVSEGKVFVVFWGGRGESSTTMYPYTLANSWSLPVLRLLCFACRTPTSQRNNT